MSTTYGTSKTVTIPSDGDTIDAVDVNVPIAALWDEHDVLADLTALQAILVPTHGLIRYVRGYGHFVFVTSGTYSASTVASPWILTATDGTPGRWVMDLTANSNRSITRFVPANMPCLGSVAATSKSQTILGPLTQIPANASLLYEPWANGIEFDDVDSAAANGRHLIFPLDAHLVDGATLSSVYWRLKGVTVARAALPLMMPAIGIMRYRASSDTLVGLRAAGMLDDNAANVAAYEAFHEVTYTCDQNNVIDRGTYSYHAIVCNEGNTNANPNLKIYGFQLVMTTVGYM